jgi:hypothetical protein
VAGAVNGSRDGEASVAAGLAAGAGVGGRVVDGALGTLPFVMIGGESPVGAITPTEDSTFVPVPPTKNTVTSAPMMTAPETLITQRQNFSSSGIGLLGCLLM